MSSIQKIENSKGISYRAYIRRKGINTITKTFTTKNHYKAAISVVFSYACREYDLPFNCYIWVDYTYLGHILLNVLQKVYKKYTKSIQKD